MTDAGALAPATLDPGSFRDPRSRVFRADGRIFRALSEQGLADWRALASISLCAELVDGGALIPTWEIDGVDPPAGLHGAVAGVLEHEVVPFVSYPYEWTFGMLKDAALLQLDILRRALDAGLTLKDATPYNVQFRGVSPVFVDVGSFEPLTDGEPWVGYRQFCMLFLYPLLLQAYADVPFQARLRGSLDGITPEECSNLLSGRRRYRKGVLTHVSLHSKLERRYAGSGGEVKKELKSAGFSKELIQANVKRLQKLIAGLEWNPPGSTWSGYELTTTYTGEDAERKAAFVAAAVASERPRRVWDLGCNEGRHARIAAETAETVVALDADALVLERLYRALKQEQGRNILPLVGNLVDPSPSLGWRGLERRTLDARGTPDLALALALIHHVVIGGNVPVAEFLDWLRSLECALVIEFPTPDDPMVRRLLDRKRPGDHPDYERDFFERALRERFEIERSEELATGARVLYLARPRG